MNYKHFDVIETIVDFPEYGIRAGGIGTIVDVYPDGELEVEFADKAGETVAIFAVAREQIKLASNFGKAA